MPNHENPTTVASSLEDPIVKAFCSDVASEIFHSVAHQHQIWVRDPYDVESIHTNASDDDKELGAREMFDTLLQRSTSPSRPSGSAESSLSDKLPYGHLLLILGEAGAGKTHLMRAFRHAVHGRGLGYCGYLQMTAPTDNYGRYLLSNLIESLDHPYSAPEVQASGLMRLSNALAENSERISNDDLELLRTEEIADGELGMFIAQLVDQIQKDDRYAQLDMELLRALLYLQRDDNRIKTRVLRYLHCEDMADHDRKILGGIVPRSRPEDAQKMVQQIGNVISTVHDQQASLVLLVDQLEDIYNLNDAKVQFRRALDALRDTTERVPSSIVVIACLSDYYTELRQHLTRANLDKLENDPAPIRLKSQRTSHEVTDLVANRMQNLYDVIEESGRDGERTYPIEAPYLDNLTNFTARQVLSWCREYRERCAFAGRMIAPELDEPSVSEESNEQGQQESVQLLEQEWNVFHRESTFAPPDDEAQLASLLGWAIENCGAELETSHEFVAHVEDRLISIAVMAADNTVDQLVAGICNKGAQGGGLSTQVEEVVKKAGEHIPVFVRCTEFTKSPTAKIAKRIGELITSRGARRVVVEDSEWRMIQALKEFEEARRDAPAFQKWRCEEKPLTQLKCLHEILRLRLLRPFETAVTSQQIPQPKQEVPAVDEKEGQQPETSESANVAERDSVKTLLPTSSVVRIGVSTGLSPTEFQVDPTSFVTHGAFLGATKSGKTTAALNVIEQLLLLDVPTVLVDRKGDLSRYACAKWLAEKPGDQRLAERKKRFRSSVDVKLFTPGEPDGNPLSISVVPKNLNELPSDKRHKMAEYAASALGSMMKYKPSQTSDTKTVILSLAIRLLGEMNQSEGVSLAQLVELLHQQDPALVNAMGYLDTKLLPKLVNELETLRKSPRGSILSSAYPPLDIHSLLGRNAASAGKTRLTIICTKFLSKSEADFWVSKLLVEIDRWGSKHPSDSLQATFMFDEADCYLPAIGKPATKEPMENLLRRARSAGIGVFLATQSPGDFDYRCRNNIDMWFLGKITQDTAINKMKPLLNECPIDAGKKLPGQKSGEFFVTHRGEVTEVKSDRSMMDTIQISEQDIVQLAKRSRDV